MTLDRNDSRDAELLSAEQIASILRCSAMTVRRHAAAGKFPPPLRVGKLCRWTRAAVLSFLV